ncbi:surfactin synthase thioesterase subunit [Cellulomonas oligotrophica]|uniref:Surfactin synthase thioesterase subunit n=1 Tax=Cellulomonas oligotrophica TaxID=931536 RepID=A0A7Y9JWN7_9CELL|nr:surfactin synthase thioesterase subunit [Cellulomonas oligotrophica]
MGVEVVGRCGAPGGVRLHCFPHAGGSAAAFRRWVGAFGEVPVLVASCGGDDGRPGRA